MKMKNAKSGFTLVEIMIVVMIIGLLAAIALPSFQRARRTANKNACIENLRQINGAVQQYLIELRTTTVPSNTDANFLDFFQTQSYPTCPAGGVYSQPANDRTVPTCNLGPTDGHTLTP